MEIKAEYRKEAKKEERKRSIVKRRNRWRGGC